MFHVVAFKSFEGQPSREWLRCQSKLGRRSIVPDIHPASREIPFPEPNRRGEISKSGSCSMLSLLRVFFSFLRGLRDSLHESDSVARVNSEEGPLFPISTLLHERFRFQNQTEGGKSVSQGAAPVLDEWIRCQKHPEKGRPVIPSGLTPSGGRGTVSSRVNPLPDPP